MLKGGRDRDQERERDRDQDRGPVRDASWISESQSRFLSAQGWFLREEEGLGWCVFDDQRCRDVSNYHATAYGAVEEMIRREAQGLRNLAEAFMASDPISDENPGVEPGEDRPLSPEETTRLAVDEMGLATRWRAWAWWGWAVAAVEMALLIALWSSVRDRL
jgi:hypothetical protein